MKVGNVSMKGSSELIKGSRNIARMKGSQNVARPWRGWRGLGRRTVPMKVCSVSMKVSSVSMQVCSVSMKVCSVYMKVCSGSMQGRQRMKIRGVSMKGCEIFNEGMRCVYEGRP